MAASLVRQFIESDRAVLLTWQLGVYNGNLPGLLIYLHSLCSKLFYNAAFNLWLCALHLSHLQIILRSPERFLDVAIASGKSNVVHSKFRAADILRPLAQLLLHISCLSILNFLGLSVESSGLGKQAHIIGITFRFIQRLRLVVHLATFSWAAKVADLAFWNILQPTTSRLVSLILRCHSVLLLSLRNKPRITIISFPINSTFQGHFASLDLHNRVDNVFKTSLIVILAHIVANLVRHPIVSLLKAYSHSTLLSVLRDLALSSGQRVSVVLVRDDSRRHLSHFDPTCAILTLCCRIGSPISCKYALFTVSCAQYLVGVLRTTSLSTRPEHIAHEIVDCCRLLIGAPSHFGFAWMSSRLVSLVGCLLVLHVTSPRILDPNCRLGSLLVQLVLHEDSLLLLKSLLIAIASLVKLCFALLRLTHLHILLLSCGGGLEAIGHHLERVIVRALLLAHLIHQSPIFATCTLVVKSLLALRALQVCSILIILAFVELTLVQTHKV